MPAATITARQREEITVGTREMRPFGNDMAADFANTLDDAAPDQREDLVRETLRRVVQAGDYLEAPEGEEAVAAAALIGAQCPGGDAVSASYGPEEPMPAFTDDLRVLAVDALDRVVAEKSEIADLWDEPPNGLEWRRGIRRLRPLLAPDSDPQEAAPFDLWRAEEDPRRERPGPRAGPNAARCGRAGGDQCRDKFAQA
ncbi:DUF4259 domain-containing protein [Streptomyces flaveolus]|uniref:DUF4259 domain-containing protein n=1 Tax=Streptomyces flaveolus TaxID=67297 RepID=UPI0033329EB3